MGKKVEVVEAEVIDETPHQERFDMVETEEQLPAAAFTPTDMIQHAIKSGAGMETMERLFDLQVKYEENEAKKAYFAAFASFKSEVIDIIKDKSVGYTGKGGKVGYDHASIGNVISTITPYLSKHALSLNWDTVQNGQITVTCTLTHALGFSQSTSLSAGKDNTGNKNEIQQVISTQTYLQRHTALAITGLATRDQTDDDGKEHNAKPVEHITEDQWRELDTLISQVDGKDVDYFCKSLRIDGMDLLPAEKFKGVESRLNEMIKEQTK